MNKANQKTRRNDVLLVLVLAAIAGGLFAYNRIRINPPAAQIEISVNGAVATRFPFGEARTWSWEENGDFVEVVSDAEGARIAASSCPDQLCVRQGTISLSGRSVVCLPNRVGVRLTAETQPDIDAALY